MFRVIVKGAVAGPVAALLFEGDAPGLDEADEVGVGIEAGDVAAFRQPTNIEFQDFLRRGS